MTEDFKASKLILNLPSSLEPNTSYWVRRGDGFDLFLSDVTGRIAHKLNSGSEPLIENVRELPEVLSPYKLYSLNTNSNDSGIYAVDNAEQIYKLNASKYLSPRNVESLINETFRGSVAGFAFDFNDITTLYSDLDGNIPVKGVGDYVGYVRDKSGNRNHAIATGKAYRPTLGQDVLTGSYYLKFEGGQGMTVPNLRFETSVMTCHICMDKLNDSLDSTIFNFNKPNQTPMVRLAVGSGRGQESVTSSHGISRITSAVFRKSSDSSYNAPKKLVVSARYHMYDGSHVLYIDGRMKASQGRNTRERGRYGTQVGYIGHSQTITPGWYLTANLYSMIVVGKSQPTGEVEEIKSVLEKQIKP